MTRSTNRPRRLITAVVLAGLTAPLGAAVATASTDTTTPTTEGTPPSSTEPLVIEGDPVCTPYVGITAALSTESPDPEAITALVAELEANTPEDLAEDLPVLTDAVGQVLASQGEDFSAFETPEFAEAQTVADQWIFENCEFDQKIEVDTIEYGFDGLPEELESGVTAMLVTNKGAQSHEMVLLRRNDDVTETWEELLELPEEEAMTKATPAGGGFVPMTGSSTLIVADLTAGDYVALCFVPEGTMMHDGEMTEGTGPPHFVSGMMTEFVVADA